MSVTLNKASLILYFLVYISYCSLPFTNSANCPNILRVSHISQTYFTSCSVWKITAKYKKKVKHLLICTRLTCDNYFIIVIHSLFNLKKVIYEKLTCFKASWISKDATLKIYSNIQENS